MAFRGLKCLVIKIYNKMFAINRILLLNRRKRKLSKNNLIQFLLILIKFLSIYFYLFSLQKKGKLADSLEKTRKQIDDISGTRQYLFVIENVVSREQGHNIF